jgi:hypothetical protein
MRQQARGALGETGTKDDQNDKLHITGDCYLRIYLSRYGEIPSDNSVKAIQMTAVNE